MKTISCFLQSVFVALCILFIAIPVFAQQSKAEYPEEIAARLQDKYDSLDSLSFTFKQRSSGQLSGRPKTGSGTAFFYKHEEISKMRWNYNEPDRQVLLSDGRTFSMYFEELKQMIVTPAEQLNSDLTYSFFSGQGRISEKFHIFPPDPEYLTDQNNAQLPSIIKLVPIEENSQVQDIHVWVSDDSLIRRIEIQDHFGTITLINISDIEENPLADFEKDRIAQLFSFTPPEGTEIIKQ